jgi:hypothetical protein
MPPTQAPSNGLDPQIVNLAQAIRQVESNNNPTAVGKSGEYGAYQFEPATWAAKSAAAGVNVPLQQSTLQQQNEVAYKTLASWKQQHPDWNIGNFASAWNAGEGAPNAYQENHVGTNSMGVSYDTPGYAKKVADAYHAIKSNGGQQSNAQVPGVPAPGTNTPSAPVPGIAPPQAPAPQPQATTPPPAAGSDPSGGFFQGLQEDLSGTNPDSIGTQIGNTLIGAGNFLFPSVGDAYHDIKGDNKKTLLQQAGDLGTSALGAASLIPGLDVVADPLEAARGAEAGVEGAGAVAKSTGLLGKLGKAATGSIGKNAALGYGYGTASSLAQGNSLVQSIAPNATNVGGALLGGASTGLLKGLGGIGKAAAGINPQIETELSRMGSQGDPADEALYDQYINATKTHATDLTKTSPLSMAADNLDTAAQKVQEQTDAAGAEVGAAKKAGATISLAPIDSVGTQFQQHVADKYGLKLVTDDATGHVSAVPEPGSMRQVAPGDIRRIEDMATQLNKLASSVDNKTGTVKNATEIMDNLNSLVDHSKADIYGHTNDPLEGLIKDTAGQLNKVIGQSSPDLAAANAKFSGLKNLQGEIAGMAGKTLNKGELLMRRVFSGDKSGEVQDLFGKIKQATGVDLVKHAVLAKHAIETVGGDADKTLLEHILKGAPGGHAGMFEAGLNIAKGALKKTVSNPESIGRKLVSGKRGNGLLGRIPVAGAISASRGIAPAGNYLNQ